MASKILSFFSLRNLIGLYLLTLCFILQIIIPVQYLFIFSVAVHVGSLVGFSLLYVSKIRKSEPQEKKEVEHKEMTEDRLEEKKKQQQKLKRKRSEGESLPLY